MPKRRLKCARSSNSTPVNPFPSLADRSAPLLLSFPVMHIIQEEIGLPTFQITPVKKGDDTHAVFSIAPLPPGYAMTLGNGLRRVLLSSLPGAAVTALRVS